ncbi:MAG TPA: hypothetical protein P5218_03865, partial [Planctomycetota bacterium]|nr:hypothetical protein [Planctomycetota bacterium]
ASPAPWNATGGNPGGMITAAGMGPSGGATNLATDLLLPKAAGQPWSGDFRLAGVTAFQYDREVTAGFSAFGDSTVLVLADSNGTAAFNDDAFIVIPTGDTIQGAAPWTTVNVPIPSASVFIGATFEAGAMPNNPNVGLDNDALWNAIIQSVDYIALANGSPLGGFPVGTHDMNYDNFLLDGTGSMVGTPFCQPMAVNSTGMSTRLFGTLTNPGGSGLHLDVVQGPVAEFGYFLVGTGVSDPGLALSDGFLCLSVTGGNTFGRYNVVGGALNSVGNFNASGEFNNLVGTSSTGLGFDVPNTLPLGGSPMILSGQTWHFQLWHRDTIAGTGHSNFSNGLSYTF